MQAFEEISYKNLESTSDSSNNNSSDDEKDLSLSNSKCIDSIVSINSIDDCVGDDCEGGECVGGNCVGGDCCGGECGCECDCGSDDSCKDEFSKKSKTFYLSYNELDEIQNENYLMNYHINKNIGHWKIAKNIISESTNDKSNSEFFIDYLDLLFNLNEDNFDNIKKVIYKKNDSKEEIYEMHEFDSTISKYIVDNLKIIPYTSPGYVFKNNETKNKWSFKIVVITSKDIYSFNRYIENNNNNINNIKNNHTIGFY